MANQDDLAVERFIALAKRLDGLATGTLVALGGGFILYGTGYYQWIPAGMVIPVLAFRLLGWLMIDRYNLAAERARRREQDDLQLLEKARQEMLALEESNLSEVEQQYLKGKVKQVLEQRLPASPSNENERLLPPGNSN